MHRNRPTTALTWILLVTLVVNSTTAPAILHSHSDWDISGDHHFGGPAGAIRQPTSQSDTKTGHVCAHGHRHHRGGLHTHSIRAERSAVAKVDRVGDSATLSAATLSAATLSATTVVRHLHVSWLAVEFTIPAAPEGSSGESDRDQDSAPSVIRLYDHTSPVIRGDVGGKIDLASCCESVASGNFDDSAFRAVGSASASPPLLCGMARPQRLGVLRI